MFEGFEPDALIFDCDGTLADTMPAHHVAWQATMSRYGITFTRERFYELGGVPTVRIIEMLAAEAGLELDAAAVAMEKELAFHEHLDSVQPLEPVVAIARANRGRLPMAVATGTERWSAERVLQRVGVLDWFDHLVCADDVERPKPSPDVYLAAAGLLGVEPGRCLVYEDTDLGLRGVAAAGMVGVDIRAMVGREN